MMGSELVEAMAVVVDHLVNACDSTSGLDRAVEIVVGMAWQVDSTERTSRPTWRLSRMRH